jgi:hypothetical protein
MKGRTELELLGIAFIAAGLALYLALPGWIRKRRRRDMGLPPRLPSQRGTAKGRGTAPQTVPLPHREKDWRNDPSVAWTSPRYYSSARKRLDD